MVARFVSLPSTTGMQNPVGFQPCQGLYFAPQGGAKVAFIATHYNVTFESTIWPVLCQRGLDFLDGIRDFEV